MACPSAVVPKGSWPDGLSHQEASQADGEEEAPQAAEEDADPAQEQEVAVLAGAAGLAGAPVACPRSPPPGLMAACPVGRLSLTSASEPVDQGSMMRNLGDSLVASADLTDNGRCGSLIPRSERIWAADGDAAKGGTTAARP